MICNSSPTIMTGLVAPESVLHSLELSRSVKENHGSKIIKIATSLFNSPFSNLVAVLSSTQVRGYYKFNLITSLLLCRLTFMIQIIWAKVTWTFYRITPSKEARKSSWTAAGWLTKATGIWRFCWNRVILNC